MPVQLKKQDFSPTQSNGNKALVVLLEDQISMRKALRRVMESTQAYKVEEFSSSAEAIEFLSSNPVDLVVSDIYLSKGNGFDCLHYVRNRALGNDIPFLFVTGEGTKDDIVLALELGASNYLLKPFDTNDLLAKMKKLYDSWKAPNPKWERIRKAETLFYEKNIGKAKQEFEELYRDEPNSAKVMVSLAQIYLKLGRETDAQQLVESSIETAPLYFPAYAVHTNILLKQGKNEEAIASLVKELSIHGKQPDRRVLLADLYVGQKDHSAALEHLRKALLDFPKEEKILLRVGELYMEIGDFEKAIHYFLKTRRKNPNSTKALDAIVSACVATGNVSKAQTLFAEALRLKPQSKDVLLAKAKLSEKVGDYDTALADVDAFLLGEVDSSDALMLKGRILLKMGEEELAIQCFVHIEERAPSGDSFGKIGLIALRLKKYDLARTYLKKSLLWDASNVKYTYALGNALESSKQFLTAAATYKKVLLLEPAHTEALEGLKRIAEIIRKVS